MPVLKQSAKQLYLGIGNTFLIINTSNGEHSINTLPPISIPENPSKAQEELFQETPDITSIAISLDNCYLVITTHNRQVVIYNLNDLSVISNFVINRAASKICFDLQNNVIVADKTGDAYLYKNGQQEKETLLLGHLSMLLDVLITPCGKFIITSDRDEKIRVSHYPNCYNILCFCLGHQEFVTNVAIVNNQLLSASGDGTIRLWDYTTGTELQQIDTNQLLRDSSQITEFKEAMDKESIEVNAIPITDMQVYEHRPDVALIALTLFKGTSVELYEFDFGCKIAHMQSIKKENSSMLITFCLGLKLAILMTDKFVIYDYDNNTNKYVLGLREFDVFKQYENYFIKNVLKTDVALLYKRKFDNVQEYLERKKQRLDAK